MARHFGSTSTVLISTKDLVRLIKHYGPTHVSVGRTWFNNIVTEPAQPVVSIPKILGARISNAKKG